jgi:uncharacterized repeat protein (TIGR01451 family)
MAMKKTLALIVGLGLFSAAPAAWANLSNTASTTYKDALNSSYSANSNSVTVTVITVPSIALTKSASPTSVASGGTVTFTIAYKNNGGAANSVVITDTIPLGSTLVAGSISNSGTVSTNVITWNIGNVAAGASGTVSFKVTAD